MRTGEQFDHSNWLLKVGSNECPHIDGLDDNLIEISPDMICRNEAIILEIFGRNIQQLRVEELSIKKNNCVTQK